MYYSLFVLYKKNNEIENNVNTDIQKIILAYTINSSYKPHFINFKEKLENEYKVCRVSLNPSINYGWNWFYDFWEGFRKRINSRRINFYEPLLEIWVEKDKSFFRPMLNDSSWRI